MSGHSYVNRIYSVSRTVQAGCYVCHGYEAHWFSKNAQAVAARHHDATGHQTWCDVAMTIVYGEDNKQIQKLEYK